jgi:hypothetical protein
MSRENFREVDTLRHDDGVVAIISERVDNGRHSVGVMREFDRRGQTERSTFLAPHQIPAAIDLLTQANGLIEQLEDRARARLRKSHQ